MFVLRRPGLDVVDLFVDVPLHASAERRVKLREIADLHGITVADFDSAMRQATGSEVVNPAGLHVLRDADSLVRVIMLRPVFSAPRTSTIRRFSRADTGYFSSPLRYFSASIAAAQPEPAAVTACL